MAESPTAMGVREALEARRSVRGFLETPVPQATLQGIFEAAQRAPSWCNIQPWRVWVTSGAATERLREALVSAASAEAPSPEFAWPQDYPEPYGQHRRECGKALYSAMGVARTDTAGRQDAWLRNYKAFDAPHVAMVAIDRRFDFYAGLDLGCWLQSLMLAAIEAGVSTCSAASLATHPAAVRSVLAIPEGLGLVLGVAMGYEDAAVAANACRTRRSALSDNITFVGE
ncbi:MAG: nitroreductase [Myxococcales bacterium]|nr:nitroreductase [Myxococcales bacterium]